MSKVSSVQALVNLWPTRADLAADVNERCPHREVTTSQVHKWAERGVIPARYQFAVLAAGNDRGFEITADLILRLHMVRRDAA